MGEGEGGAAGCRIAVRICPRFWVLMREREEGARGEAMEENTEEEREEP